MDNKLIYDDDKHNYPLCRIHYRFKSYVQVASSYKARTRIEYTSDFNLGPQIIQYEWTKYRFFSWNCKNTKPNSAGRIFKFYSKLLNRTNCHFRSGPVNWMRFFVQSNWNFVTQIHFLKTLNKFRVNIIIM